ncbi:HAMP domain-containing sensor histidine kinase [Sphingobium aquiterrae]|uniref:sensor histidine kinase n=1 Tax=Sphingobium aquiterrae TaxID=2038656 RepID=UPI00301878B3
MSATTLDDARIVRAALDRDGIVRSADPPLLALQMQAGGGLDMPLLVPQLAALARLAGRLNVLISRPAVAGGAHADIDMWVHVRPHEAGIELSITDWRERPVARPSGESMTLEAATLADGGWTWRVDTRMRFISADAQDRLDMPLPAAGMPLTGWFQLLPDAGGVTGLLQALAERRAFSGQRALLLAPSQALYRLDGAPMFDMTGRLIGYRGVAVPEPVDEAMSSFVREQDIMPPSASSLFGRRLDRALKQPLGRIIANAETISGQLEGPLRQDYAAYAADIAAAGRHLLELVDDLADLQAVERADFTTIEEDVDLADVARRAAGLLGMRARERRIEIVPPQPSEALVVRAEFRRVLQILVNLIGNAVRYSPEGSSIWIRVDMEDGTGRVVVADQGRGIAAEDQDRIFDKFERLGRDEAGGSGLGLYISRRLARAMRGDIGVESAPGQGARFTLSLPIASS